MTITDALLGFLTPLMILIMVASVIYFLLDVRFVYTTVMDRNLRFVAFFFVMGVVALNRLIAQQGGGESILYIFGLGIVTVIYTMGTLSQWEAGSVARGFLDSPGTATVFNLAAVSFIWWVTNRLTKECCVDENPYAGEIGIFQNTLRKARAAMTPQAPQRKQSAIVRKRVDNSVVAQELDAIDPSEWKPPEKKKHKASYAEPAERLARRHPGVSIFYFSVPVMLIFALGLRVLPHGGPGMVARGHALVGAYSFSALTLLMLTSLAGLRMYFQERRVPIPPSIGVFWLSLGFFMVLVVLLGALALPLPDMPPVAHVGYQETDFWTYDRQIELLPVEVTAEGEIRQGLFLQRLGQGVLIGLGLFAGYGALRGLGSGAAALARRRAMLPQWMRRFFDAVDQLIQRLLRMPSLPRLQWRQRTIQRDLATCVAYRNPMRSAMQQRGMTNADIIAHAYEALCALAYDLGVPRRPGQTPYEFLREFPRELKTLEEEATELTNLFVLSNYGGIRFDDRVQDRVRRFWQAYEVVRQRVVR